ncbi:hypothetical protein IMG5_183420 [Ichthyophthirius multifiliis]|uniref:Calmodulin n=1 Tax=Ichthyophthirius multifiliis TaxID=5932 RepID=G0R362_ICHMU|nr:hypothetical protein IMG5_183420 [Ichthyophthirius multifiliis]EGR28085.1 hypothetical protein IMG5_183420 [Ichthyophthirius multifiliis]|eukprot:XP_004027430.1 hypothetical protein IMG5_183420 [Ichthyophthirius multifiliis]
MNKQIQIEQKGEELINNFISTWTQKYLYQTTYQTYNTFGHVFMTEFSLPLINKPIPKATVKVYFYLNEDESSVTGFNLKFRFESDSLIHNPQRTLRISQMEKWLEKILEKKAMTSQILFLGTEFEATRIKDPRLDKIFEELNYHEEVIEDKYLSKQLLQFPEELEVNEEFVNEDEQIEVMKKALFDVFRSVDQQDMGVLSFNECMQVYNLMGLQLSKEQWQELMIMADSNQNGIIEYKEFIPLGAEIIHGIFMKNQAKKSLREGEEEYLHQSILILQNDEMHSTIKQLIQKCREFDEDELTYISSENLIKIFQEFGDQFFNKSEGEELMKQICRDYPDNDIPYEKLYDILLNFRIVILKNGLMESQLNNLEIYIRDICKPYDTENKGFIYIDDLMHELKKSKEIILTKTQTYIIKSFIDKDENNMVNYLTGSRILSLMIKKFFTPNMIKKKLRIQNEGIIPYDKLMKGWTYEELKSDLEQLYNQFSTDQNQKLDFKQLKIMMRKCRFRSTDEEIQNYIQEFGQDGVIQTLAQI